VPHTIVISDFLELQAWKESEEKDKYIRARKDSNLNGFENSVRKASAHYEQN